MELGRCGLAPLHYFACTITSNVKQAKIISVTDFTGIVPRAEILG